MPDNISGTSRQAMTIDLDRAVVLELPHRERGLEPKRFTIPDGRDGWSVGIPGHRPIATPAYEDGLLLIGGGYGSYEFYAFDALTGQMVWKIHTTDDGPTAAVVERGLVAFNTESCTVIVCEARTGRILWQEWLGDPLMSQPAISGNRLFIAYLAHKHKPVLRPEMTNEERLAAVQAAKAKGYGDLFGHRLLCADLLTGRHIWEQEITGDVITSPVVDGDQVFVTCLDGVSFCLQISDGAVVWKKENQGTSAPLIVNGRVVMTEKEVQGGKVYERMRRARRHTGAYQEQDAAYQTESPYRSADRGGGSSLRGEAALGLDSGTGFGSAPASAKLHAASAHLGIGTVSGAWAYQGSRTAYHKGRLFNSQGRHVCCLRDQDQTVAWESQVTGSGVDLEDQVFLPPSLGREYMYLTSLTGHALSVRQETGEVGFMYTTGRSICFQPCLAGGRMYFGTGDGGLVCIETGSDDADGWYMWGGNAQHNRVQES